MSTLEAAKDRQAVERIDHPDETELSPAAVTFMTTEHFVLQTARSATIAETNGRTALFLSSVSSVLVALAFFGQVSRLGTAFFVLALVVLPPLFFVELVTFERAIQTSIEEVGPQEFWWVGDRSSPPQWNRIASAKRPSLR